MLIYAQVWVFVIRHELQKIEILCLLIQYDLVFTKAILIKVLYKQMPCIKISF